MLLATALNWIRCQPGIVYSIVYYTRTLSVGCVTTPRRQLRGLKVLPPHGAWITKAIERRVSMERRIDFTLVSIAGMMALLNNTPVQVCVIFINSFLLWFSVSNFSK